MTTTVPVGPSPLGGGPAPYPAGLLPLATPRRSLVTTRELQVLRLAANGHTNASIGLAHNVSEHTVKAQMKSILQKLGVDDRAQAVAVAMCLGLLTTGDIRVPAAATRSRRAA